MDPRDDCFVAMRNFKLLKLAAFQKKLDEERLNKEKRDAIRDAIFKAARDQRDWADDVADFS